MVSLLAGIDLGGTSIKAAVATTAGEVVRRDTMPTESHRSPVDVIHRMGQLVRRLLEESGHNLENLTAVGIGVPGLVDVSKGLTKFLPNLPTQWRDVPVAALLQAELNCPVRLLNDVRTATLGELRFGYGQNQPGITMAFFSVGTGIGGGIAIDGRLRLGPLGAAGELGHQTMISDGARCGCGNTGCLETLASGPAIAAEGIRLMQTGLAPQLHRLVDGRCDRITPREMLAAAEAGDHLIYEALQKAARWIGVAAANVVTVLHPDVIVLGGGVAELGDLLTSNVQRVIRERVGMFPAESVRVVRSQLGEAAGLIGAIALAQSLLE